MQDTGRGRTPQLLEDILQRVEDRLDIGPREVSHAVNMSHSIVGRVLRNEGLHPYPVQKVQALIPAVYAAAVGFAGWFLQQLAALPDFSARVINVLMQLYSRRYF